MDYAHRHPQKSHSLRTKMHQRLPLLLLPLIRVHLELHMLVNRIVRKLASTLVGFIAHFRGTLNRTTLNFRLYVVVQLALILSGKECGVLIIVVTNVL